MMLMLLLLLLLLDDDAVGELAHVLHLACHGVTVARGRCQGRRRRVDGGGGRRSR